MACLIIYLAYLTIHLDDWINGWLDGWLINHYQENLNSSSYYTQSSINPFTQPSYMELHMLSMIHRYNWDVPRDHKCRFRVYSHGLNELMPKGIGSYMSNDDWMLIFFNDPVEVDLGKGLTKVPANSLVLWSPSDNHHYGNPKNGWLHSWIHFTGTDVSGILERTGFQRLKPVQVNQPQMVEDYLIRMFNEISSHSEPNDLIVRNLFENWLLEMSRARVSEKKGIPSESIMRLKRHLDMNLTQKISLAAMSKVANLSVSHLSFEFRKEFGVSPVNYLIRRRMDTAKYLLANRDMTVSEVATECGYPDVFQFSRMFKRVTGYSPKFFKR